MDRDARKLLATRGLRAFAYGYLAVILTLYLQVMGLSPPEVGGVIAAAVAASAATTLGWSLVADRYGRRRTLASAAAAMIASGLLFAWGGSVWALVAGALTGTISASSSEVGPFITVEQVILADSVPDAHRTWLFSIYDTLGSLAGAVGALFSAVVSLLTHAGLSGAEAYRPLFVLYAVIGAVNLVIFLTLDERVERAHLHARRSFTGLHRSRGTVAKLAALFGLDAFAGGFVIQSLVVYWFHLRWGLSPVALAVVFFWVGVLSGFSLLAASWLAQRFGLLRTMVFTHLPSNILLMLVPLAPSAWLAVGLFLARMSLCEMDVPTRRSYTMAIVDPDERAATAGLTNVARGAASSVSPALSGLAFGAAALGLPFVIAGGLKVAYDLLTYRTFRSVHPPEERGPRH